MLKELLVIFQKHSKLDQAYKRSFEMLDITREMFLGAKQSLRTSDSSKFDKKIFEQDKEINRYEREVRRDVFQHLTISGTEDLYSGLLLISIIIDIERLGDYTKNIFELALNHPAKLKGGKFKEDLKKVEDAVEDSFTRVRKVFETADAVDAEELIKEYLWVNKLCDQRVIDYMKEADSRISSGDAVSLAMYFRYLKRINSHLRNIATSVCNPFDRIGFVPSELRGAK
jgi:phosphate uptake regulator